MFVKGEQDDYQNEYTPWRSQYQLNIYKVDIETRKLWKRRTILKQ